MGGPSVSISEENAFTSLISQYDSIKIIRKSDGASTITYHNGDNATDEQRYFFTRDAWICSPDIEGYEGDRTYTLKLTDGMFHWAIHCFALESLSLLGWGEKGK